MIRSLTGTIAAHTDTSVTIQVHGIGYLVYTNALRYPPHLDETVFFHTYLAVRENALDLYGFRSEDELRLFMLLLDIPKIGPKSALQIMCAATPHDLTTAAAQNDPDLLHTTTGIGKKTAAAIVAHLVAKLDPTFLTLQHQALPQTTYSSSQTDAIDALITLGYPEKEARALVSKLDPALSVSAMVQQILRQIPPV